MNSPAPAACRVALVLFTRDLRVRDQPALAAAVREADSIVPLFVFDEALLGSGSGTPNRLAFLLDSLADLDGSLRERGARLVVRRGEVVREVLRVASEVSAQAIYMSADVSAYARRRHRRLAAACERERIQLRTFPGVTLLPPGAVLPSGGGDHYRVFTPYWRAWSELPRRMPERAPRRIPMHRGVSGGSLPALRDLTRERPSPGVPMGGEDAGSRQLARWLRRGLAGYERGHDDLVADATSRLSPYLHFGCLSASVLAARVEGRGDRLGNGSEGPERLADGSEGLGATRVGALEDATADSAAAFIRQLCWRDFHFQVLAARPDLPRVDYRSRDIRWRRGKRLLEAWQRGETGLPIVDAGMRQLMEEGFMHNRARLITASFLTRLLRVDWRLGAAHFAGLLVDADLACNVGNWQWVAGTGNDTRPNRVFNPLRQARRFDPAGEYVRRYVPELAAVAGRAVHEPWLLEAGVRAKLDYPQPVLDWVGSPAAE